MVVALAALEANIISPKSKVTCRGCLRPNWGGSVPLLEKKRARFARYLRRLKNSCDVYFYDVAKRLGIDRIAAMARRFGLGDKTGVTLVSEKSGLIPTRAWKKALIGSAWQKLAKP